MNIKGLRKGFTIVAGTIFLASPAFAVEAGSYDILRNGLMGAAVGAISSEVSGGKAGTGALVGAGTQVIGKALFDVLLPAPSQNSAVYSNQTPVYYQPSQQPVYSQPTYYNNQPVYSQPVYYTPAPQQTYTQPVYRRTSRRKRVYRQPARTYNNGYIQPQADTNRQIIRSGLMGAAVGAISAEASGGKAGTGALIGAGTNVIGGSLLEILFPQN